MRANPVTALFSAPSICHEEPAENAGVGVFSNFNHQNYTPFELAQRCEDMILSSTGETIDTAESYFKLAERHGGLEALHIRSLKQTLEARRRALADYGF